MAMSGRKKWSSLRFEPLDAPTLENVRRAILSCLAESRGGTVDGQVEYLDDVLRRARASERASWADFYRALGILRDDALAEGVSEAMVRDHVRRLQRILEQVVD